MDRRKAEKGERNQAASHSIHVVGQLKTELMDTARVSFVLVTHERILRVHYSTAYNLVMRLSITPAYVLGVWVCGCIVKSHVAM